MVTLSGSGSRVAGTSYTLTCSVAPPTGVQFDDSVPPTIQWPELNITIQGMSWDRNDAHASSITLNPLHKTHSGQYSCRASYSLGGISSEEVTDEMNVSVFSKF